MNREEREGRKDKRFSWRSLRAWRLKNLLGDSHVRNN